MEEKKSNGQEKLELVSRYPELVPLSQEQKDAFLYLWTKMPDYKRRLKLVGSIPDLYCNRMRYRELLPPSERAEFDRIQSDPKVRL